MSVTRFLCAALACVLTICAVGAAPAVARGGAVELSLDKMRVSTRLGDNFGFRSRITNTGSKPLPALVAHLNVVSLTRGVYVDPEDWSSQRTQYLDPLGPGGSTDVSWSVEAVNGGNFAIYVVVLPGRNPATAAPGLTVSSAVDVHVTEEKTLDSGGVLPLAIGVPAMLGLLMIGLRVRRRR